MTGRFEGRAGRRMLVGLLVASVALGSALTGVASGKLRGVEHRVPTVSKLSPASGSTRGGTKVIISGKNFIKLKSVLFGSVKGSHLKVVSATRITVETPKSTKSRKVEVRVVGVYGSSKASVKLGFRFIAPKPQPAKPAAGTLAILAGDSTSGPSTNGAEATNSALANPRGIAVDTATGDVYAADTGNDVIEQVTPAGQLSVIAGVEDQEGEPTSGAAADTSDLGNPTGVAVDSTTGDLFIADSGNGLVEEVNLANDTLSIIAGGGQYAPDTTAQAATSVDLQSPTGVAVDDATGDYYVADEGDSVVLAGTPAGQLAVIAGTNPNGGTPTAQTVATSTGLNEPTGVAVNDATGDVYVLQLGANTVGEISPSGGFSVVAGGGAGSVSTSPQVATSVGLDFTVCCATYGDWDQLAIDQATGDVYVGDEGDSLIEDLTPAGQLYVVAGTGNTGLPTSGALATSSDVNEPQGVGFDSATGVLYIGDTGNNDVETVTWH